MMARSNSTERAAQLSAVGLRLCVLRPIASLDHAMPLATGLACPSGRTVTEYPLQWVVFLKSQISNLNFEACSTGSNRQSWQVEPSLSYWKHGPANTSNRQKSLLTGFSS